MAPPTEEELEEFRRQAMANPSYMASLPEWTPDAASAEIGGSNPLALDLANRVSGLKNQYETNVLEANREPELSGTQVGVSAAVKLLPLLLGMAIAKRKSLGAALGAQAGLGASGAYEQNALATQENKAKRAGLLATQNLKDLSTAQGQQFQMLKQEDAQTAQNEALDKQGKFVGTKNYNIDQTNKGSRAAMVGGNKTTSPLSDKQINDMQAFMGIAQSAQTAINRIKEIVPGLAIEESYFNPDGSFNPSKAASIVKDRIGSAVFGPDTPSGKAQAEVTATVKDVLKAYSAASSTDTEFQRVKQFVEGNGYAPSTFPAQIYLLNRLIDRQQSAAKNYVKTLQTYRNPNTDFGAATDKQFADIRSGKGSGLNANSSTTPVPRYTLQELKGAGYSDSQIETFRRQGVLD